MSFIAKIKDIWKAALKSGKIVERRLKVKQHKFDSFRIFLDIDPGRDPQERWNAFVEEEEAYRLSLASRTVEYSRFVCKGVYMLFVNVIRLISAQFIDLNGSFKHERYPGNPWKIQFVKFCNRILHSFPWQHDRSRKNWSSLELLQSQLLYIKETIQPYFSTQFKRNNGNNQTQVIKEKVTKEKLTNYGLIIVKRQLVSLII